MTTQKQALTRALKDFVDGRKTDFPFTEADPVAEHEEGHDFPRDEAELALATKLLVFLESEQD